MTEARQRPQEVAALIAQIDAQERARVDRVARVVAEIQGETGTSAEYGPALELWIALSTAKEAGSLNPDDEPRLELVGSVIRLAFGENGLVPILSAWYGPALERRAAITAAQEPTPQQPSGE